MHPRFNPRGCALAVPNRSHREDLPAFPPGAPSSFVTTSGVLPEDEYPQFDSHASARWAKPGGPFDPHTGSKYVYSQIADVTYKRLTREIAVPASGGELTFWTSYDTEPDWDFLFVEARTPGGDDWTTLPDANGNTNQNTGQSCLAGNSNGWQQWSVDLSAYASGQVEVSITYVSDWATQGLGVFVDDIEVSTGEGTTSFESGNDGWMTQDAPAGSAPNFNTWIVTDPTGFPEGVIIATPDTLYMGFGFEGITDAATRNEVMGEAMDFFLN